MIRARARACVCSRDCRRVGKRRASARSGSPALCVDYEQTAWGPVCTPSDPSQVPGTPPPPFRCSPLPVKPGHTNPSFPPFPPCPLSAAAPLRVLLVLALVGLTYTAVVPFTYGPKLLSGNALVVLGSAAVILLFSAVVSWGQVGGKEGGELTRHSAGGRRSQPTGMGRVGGEEGEEGTRGRPKGGGRRATGEAGSAGYAGQRGLGTRGARGTGRGLGICRQEQAVWTCRGWRRAGGDHRGRWATRRRPA